MKTIAKHRHKFLLLALITGLASFTSYFSDYSSVSANVFTLTGQNAAQSKYWRSVTSSSDGVKLAGAVYNGYNDYIYTSADSGITWTPRTGAGARDWTSIASSYDPATSDGTKLVAVYSGGIYTSTDSGVTWTLRSGSNNNFGAFINNNFNLWTDVASSANGNKLAVVSSQGRLFTSTDSGATWAERTTGTGFKQWSYVTSSADGTKLAIAEYTGNIYTSTNSGATWTLRTGAGSRTWRGIVYSPNGTMLAAEARNGYIYTSTDDGNTWTERTNAGSRNWFGIASSYDGTKLVASEYRGSIYTSTDSGNTWTERTTWTPHLVSQILPGENWSSIASSNNGTKLIIGTYGGYVYTSTDSGATWTGRNTVVDQKYWAGIVSNTAGNRLAAVVNMEPNGMGYVYTSEDGVYWQDRPGAGRRYWTAIASSANGDTLTATDNANIFISRSYGDTWTQSTSTVVANKNWSSVTSSSNGVKLAAVAFDGNIYTSANSGYTWVDRGIKAYWGGITSSSDGVKLAAVVEGGYIYVSNDSGVNWTQKTSTGSQLWTAVDSSDDGTHLVAVGNDIFTSNDSGNTWVQRTFNLGLFASVSSSGDGSKLAAVKQGGYIYTSTNFGETWTPQTNAGQMDLRAIASTYDGMNLFAVSSFGSLYTGVMNATDGKCGSSNGNSFTSTPTSNLCSEGIASSVTLSNDRYYWTCPAVTAGASSASCSAKYYPPAAGFTITSQSSLPSDGHCNAYYPPSITISSPSPTQKFYAGDSFVVSGSVNFPGCYNTPQLTDIFWWTNDPADTDAYGTVASYARRQILYSSDALCSLGSPGCSDAFGTSRGFTLKGVSNPAVHITASTTPGKHRLYLQADNSTCYPAWTTGYQEYIVAENGLCGTANNGNFATPPTTNLCAKGASTTVTTTGNTYTWACDGLYGTTDFCSANVSTGPACGSSAGITPVASAPTTNLCVNSAASAVTTSSSGLNYEWTCSDGNIATNQACSVPILPSQVNGLCGPAANKTYTYSEAFPNPTTPNGGYCTTGTLRGSPATPANPLPGGSTSWWCDGSNSGTNLQCFASRAATGGGGGNQVSLNPMVVTPVVPSLGSCVVNIQNTIRDYYWPATGESDPHSYCELKNQYDLSRLYVFNSSVSGYISPTYTQTNVTRDTVYTLKCWDVVNGATSSPVTKTGVCRVNVGTIETN